MPVGRTALWKVNRLREERAVRHGSPTRRGIFVPLPSTALALGILAALVAGVAIPGWTLWPKDPGNDSVEAGFLRDMFTHHAQAVEMSMIIRDRTEDPNLLALATDVALSQSTQMGTMQGYLDIWGLPLTGDDPAMTWMDHPTTGLMPGMATADQIEQLRTLPVEEAEVLFLQLMIRHHQGGVEMAQAALDRSDQEQVTFMADRTVMLQGSEITTMNRMLEERGQVPITDPLPESHEDHEG
jgi:uncharacterized protein (DUF305 family)